MRCYTRQFWISLFILIGAIVYFSHLSHGELVPLRMSLGDIPLQLGTWQGREEAVEQRVIDILGVEDSIMRYYYKQDRAMVTLYIGFYESQRQGDTIHSPKHCLPGSGWQPMEDRKENVRLQSGENITVNRYLIQKGLEQQLVLYWYQERGRIVTNEYMAKLHLIIDAITKNRTDGALVRIMSPVRASVEEALDCQKEFVSLLMPYLRKSLPE